MTTRQPRPTVAQRDLWLLVAEALEAEAFATAQALADTAIRTYGWERYHRGLRVDQDGIYYSPILGGQQVGVPRGWAYFWRDGYDRKLLIDPDAGPLLSDWDHLGTTMEVAEKLGPGLVRLDAVLAEVLLRAMTPPDDVSELTASA